MSRFAKDICQSASFAEIRAALQANFGTLNPNNAYFFCGSAALVKEVVPNSDLGEYLIPAYLYPAILNAAEIRAERAH